jgi:hypothetical protein
MSSKLELLFNRVLNKSYELRKKNKETFNGKGFWLPIKQMLDELDIFEASWKKINPKIIDIIMLKTEYKIDGHRNKKIIEESHFIIQQIRIPLEEKPTIKKIIQIALNIGQYKGIKETQYFNLFNYFSQEDISMLSSKISDKIMSDINNYLDSLS